MKKNQDNAEYWREYKKKRKEFLKFQRRYRLQHPVFNLLFKMNPIQFGLITGFVSGFVWFAVGGIPIIGMTITGLVGWLISYSVHKDFDKEKLSYGFQNMNNHEYLDRDINLDE